MLATQFIFAFVCGLVHICAAGGFAQDSSPADSLFESDGAIKDNSFLIEEAYNQETGVVQHISTLTYFASPQKVALYAFTQEWPLGGQHHQLSLTIPYSFGDPSGLGDLLISYRFQLFSENHWAAVAPRISLIIPTGRTDKGLGDGVTGVQWNFPLSKQVSDQIVVHVNLGGSLLPEVAGGARPQFVTKTITSYFAGGSVIFLPTQEINLVCEVLTSVVGTIEGRIEVEHITETIVNPGIRFGINAGNLQVVPGLSFPFMITNGVEHTGVFFYLSFEHPL